MILLLLTVLAPVSVSADEPAHNGNTALNTFANRVAALADFGARATFEVWLPSASQPVTYQLELYQADVVGVDSLMPCRYLIDWTLHTPLGDSEGFSAYFGGNYYRFGNNKLQEYHAVEDADVLAPDGQPANGVQRRSQFVDLLPAVLAVELHNMAVNPAYTCELTERNGQTTIEGRLDVRGQTAKQFKYVFDTASAMPVQLDIDTSPDLISEQNITVKYQDAAYRTVPESEDALVALYPDEFARYRRSNFRLVSLLDQPAPEFAIAQLGGERYIHHRGEAFGIPTVIAFLDTAVGEPAESAAALRQAADEYPGALQLIIAFDDNRAEEVAAVAGKTRPDEVVLTGARAMARDFGVVDRPTVVLCDAQGNIRHIIVGMNKMLADEVLHQSILLN